MEPVVWELLISCLGMCWIMVLGIMNERTIRKTPKLSCREELPVIETNEERLPRNPWRTGK